MSRRLRDFIKLINREPEERDEAEIGYFVPWLRRRSSLLKHLENSIMIDIIKHVRYMKIRKDEVLFQQGKKRHSTDPLRYFLIFRGCVSMIVNPFIQSHSVRNTPHSMEKRLLASVSPDKMAPKSAMSIKSAKSKASSRVSFPRNVDDAGRISDVSDAESEVSIDTMTVTVEYTTMTGTETITRTAKERTMATSASRASKGSMSSKKGIQRARFGKCLVKYEKGKYIGEASVMDDEEVYTATLMADGTCDILVIEDEFFNRSIRIYHDKQVSEITHFVDRHPFFCHLTERAKTTLQICLSKHHYPAGSFIVKQGAPVNRLLFITSGSAELVVEPCRHRYQFPEFWPFETSRDIYYNEFEWLRESRRKSYMKQYKFKGEVTNKRLKKQDASSRREVTMAAVQAREVIGITEVTLDLDTHVQSVRCTQDCEVYSLNRRPFKKVIQKRNPETMDLIRAYVQMKLEYRMERKIADQVPLLRSLYVKVERENRETSCKGMKPTTKARLRKREEEILKMIEWFMADKAELRPHNDVDVIQLKENMKLKAIHRQMLRDSIVGYRPFVRAGCLAMKTEPRAMSLHQLRHPIYEALLKLKTDGTRLSEQELETFLLNFRPPESEDQYDIGRHAGRVADQEVNLLHYRRQGNELVQRFLRMLEKGEMRNIPLTREETIFESVLLDSSSEEEAALSAIDEEEEALPLPPSTIDWRFESRGAESGMSRFPVYSTRPCTRNSLQFERRSVTPETLERRIRNFHLKYGAKEKDMKTLPDLHQFEPSFDDTPLPGGKVFVTRVPCVSCKKNVYIKNHNHSRCQMLSSLPMSKVRERPPQPRSPSYMGEFSPLRMKSSASFRSESADQMKPISLSRTQ